LRLIKVEEQNLKAATTKKNTRRGTNSELVCLPDDYSDGEYSDCSGGSDNEGEGEGEDASEDEGGDEDENGSDSSDNDSDWEPGLDPNEEETSKEIAKPKTLVKNRKRKHPDSASGGDDSPDTAIGASSPDTAIGASDTQVESESSEYRYYFFRFEFYQLY
jgi:hypothetical protein